MYKVGINSWKLYDICPSPSELDTRRLPCMSTFQGKGSLGIFVFARDIYIVQDITS